MKESERGEREGGERETKSERGRGKAMEKRGRGER